MTWALTSVTQARISNSVMKNLIVSPLFPSTDPSRTPPLKPFPWKDPLKLR